MRRSITVTVEIDFSNSTRRNCDGFCKFSDESGGCFLFNESLAWDWEEAERIRCQQCLDACPDEGDGK